MNKYIVSTHLGDYETMAKTPEKALSNVRYRLFGRRGYVSTEYWTVQKIG